MAPEFPPSLVVFDARFEDDLLIGSLQYVEAPAGKRLRVRWSVSSQPANYIPIGGGVAYVYDQDVGILPVSEDASPNYLGDSRYQWTEGLQFGVPWTMFVLILPEGYTLVEPQPRPVGTKFFKKRLAIYWILEGDDIGRTKVECIIKEIHQDLDLELRELNKNYLTDDVPIPSNIEVEENVIPGPIFEDARAFSSLATIDEKKAIIRRIETSITHNQIKLSKEQILQCTGSEWELDRVCLYLFEEYKSLPDIGNRVLHIQQEFERVKTATEERSLVPLHYAIRSVLRMLQQQPDLGKMIRIKADVFEDVLGYLKQRIDIDRGNEIKDNLNRIYRILDIDKKGVEALPVELAISKPATVRTKQAPVDVAASGVEQAEPCEALAGPLKLFISYSHKDDKMRAKLGEHLTPLVDEGLIRIWQDREIEAGANWEGGINKEIGEADIILLLVSASFLDSRYCRKELLRAIDQRSAGQSLPIPIILRPCDWTSVFNRGDYKTQALPRDDRPVAGGRWPNQDAAFATIARELRTRIERMRG